LREGAWVRRGERVIAIHDIFGSIWGVSEKAARASRTGAKKGQTGSFDAGGAAKGQRKKKSVLDQRRLMGVKPAKAWRKTDKGGSGTEFAKA